MYAQLVESRSCPRACSRCHLQRRSDMKTEHFVALRLLSWLDQYFVRPLEKCYYSRGMHVAWDDIFCSNVIHVHSPSIKWYTELLIFANLCFWKSRLVCQKYCRWDYACFTTFFTFASEYSYKVLTTVTILTWNYYFWVLTGRLSSALTGSFFNQISQTRNIDIPHPVMTS